MRIPEELGLAEMDEEIIRSPSTGPGVDTARQYAKFGGSYPKMGRGFPRRYIDTTPQEILYDERILGGGCPCPHRAKMIPTGETVLRQPRLETERYIMVEY